MQYSSPVINYSNGFRNEQQQRPGIFVCRQPTVAGATSLRVYLVYTLLACVLGSSAAVYRRATANKGALPEGTGQRVLRQGGSERGRCQGGATAPSDRRGPPESSLCTPQARSRCKAAEGRGHQVMLASSPGHDLNVKLAFFICRDDAERIVTRQPPRVFARALLNSTIKAHSPEMHHAWFIVRDMGDHGRHTLMGHVLVATPADASYLVDHGEFTAADVNHGDYDLSQYLISFERPRGYLQQTGMNELVVPMRAARRFSPGDDEVALNDIAKQIQSAIKRSSPSRILGCGSIDSPESVTVWDLQFALFHCSHPVLADMLSKTRLHAGFTPAFTFHTNLEEKKWKLKSMREYSEDQEKQQRDKRRSLVELLPVRSPRRGSHTAEEKDGLKRSIKMLKAISDSRISNDGQLENHLQELAECEEEQVRLRELRAVARASGSTQSASVTTAKSAPDSMSAPEGNPTVGPPPHQLTEGHHPIRDPRLRSSTSQSLPSPKELSIPSSVEKTPDLESVADDQETVGPANKRARLA